MALTTAQEKIKSLIESQQPNNIALELEISKGLNLVPFYIGLCSDKYLFYRWVSHKGADKVQKLRRKRSMPIRVFVQKSDYWHKLFRKYAPLCGMYERALRAGRMQYMELNDVDKMVLLRGKHKPFKPFNVLEECKIFSSERAIWLPSFVCYLHHKYRYSIKSIVDYLTEVFKAYTPKYSVSRTSEIFITKNTRGGRIEKRRLSFYPQKNGSWVSHIHIRKR